MQSMLSNWFQQRKKRKPQDMMTSSGSLDLGFGELNGPGVSDLMGQEDVQQLYNPNPLKGMSKGFGTRFLNTGAFGKRGLNQIAKAGYDSPEAFLQANPYLNQARQQRQDLLTKTQSMMPSATGVQKAKQMPFQKPRYSSIKMTPATPLPGGLPPGQVFIPHA